MIGVSPAPARDPWLTLKGLVVAWRLAWQRGQRHLPRVAGQIRLSDRTYEVMENGQWRRRR